MESEMDIDIENSEQERREEKERGEGNYNFAYTNNVVLYSNDYIYQIVVRILSVFSTLSHTKNNDNNNNNNDGNSYTRTMIESGLLLTLLNNILRIKRARTHYLYHHSDLLLYSIHILQHFLQEESCLSLILTSGVVNDLLPALLG